MSEVSETWKPRWLPIESNPEFLHNLGIKEPWGVMDILSLDPESASMLPEPTLAIILLLPITEKYLEHVAKIEAEKEACRFEGHLPYFMKQTITNACGTVALIHAVANNMDNLEVQGDTIIGKFLAQTHKMTPEERGRMLENDFDIANLHEAGALEGQSESLSEGEATDLHFITLINYENWIVELDGRKDRPIAHCPTDGARFVKDAFKIALDYINIDPTNVRFSAMALGPVNVEGF